MRKLFSRTYMSFSPSARGDEDEYDAKKSLTKSLVTQNLNTILPTPYDQIRIEAAALQAALQPPASTGEPNTKLNDFYELYNSLPPDSDEKKTTRYYY